MVWGRRSTCFVSVELDDPFPFEVNPSRCGWCVILKCLEISVMDTLSYCSSRILSLHGGTAKEHGRAELPLMRKNEIRESILFNLCLLSTWSFLLILISAQGADYAKFGHRLIISSRGGQHPHHPPWKIISGFVWEVKWNYSRTSL